MADTSVTLTIENFSVIPSRQSTRVMPTLETAMNWCFAPPPKEQYVSILINATSEFLSREEIQRRLNARNSK